MPFEARKKYAGAKFCNALPEHCKALEPMKLKKELKSWLSHRPFYNISEFLSWHEDEQVDKLLGFFFCLGFIVACIDAFFDPKD